MGDATARWVWGPSPRMRGNPQVRHAKQAHLGAIPADAGEPPGQYCVPYHLKGHPRGCGGTQIRSGKAYAGTGAIPADAGEPHCEYRHGDAERGHPRGCGGTDRGGGMWRCFWGPSPRMRGNLLRPVGNMDQERAIPADAGEPPGRLITLFRWWGHPRGCGGTLVRVRSTTISLGPSPRMRGNQNAGRCMWPYRGAIPADAGEP